MAKRSNKGNTPGKAAVGATGRPRPLGPAPVAPAAAAAAAAAELPDRSAHLQWYLAGFLLALVAGAGLLYGSATLSKGHELTLARARFVTANALTLTGFRDSREANTYNAPGKAVLFLLTAGGAVFSMAVGGMALTRVLRLPYSDARVLAASAATFTVATFVGAIPLIASGHWDEPEALFNAAAAFANSGLLLGPTPTPGSPLLHLVLLPLAFLGSLGLPVLLNLCDAALRRGPILPFTKLIVGLSAGVYLAALLLLFLLHGLAAGEGEWSVSRFASELLAPSAITALDGRTYGLLVHEANTMPRTVRSAAELLMLTGGGPASTAGGLGLLTLLILYRGARRALFPPSANPATPPTAAAPATASAAAQPAGLLLGAAVAYVACYLAVVGLVHVGVLLTVPEWGADRILFESVSAVTTTGLSWQPLSTVKGLDVLAVGMVLGRLLPLAFLWYLALRVPSAADELAA